MPTHPSRRTVPLLILALLLAGCQLFSSSAPPGCQPLLSAAGLDLPLETLRPGRDGSVRLPQTFRAAGYLVEGEGPLVYLDPEQAAPLLEAPAGQPASLTLPGCDLAVLPRVSAAEQEMVCVPRPRVEPEGGLQVTSTTPSTRSSAVAVKVTTAPSGPVASTVIFAGRCRTGGVVSQLTTRAVTFRVSVRVIALSCCMEIPSAR